MAYNRKAFRPNYKMPQGRRAALGTVKRVVTTIITMVTVKRRRPRWYKAQADLLLAQVIASGGPGPRTEGVLTLGNRPRIHKASLPVKMQANYASRLVEVG